jgi:hypothetical protein
MPELLLFLNFIPALISIHDISIYIFSIFSDVYPCFAVKKCTAISTLPFRALVLTHCCRHMFVSNALQMLRRLRREGCWLYTTVTGGLKQGTGSRWKMRERRPILDIVSRRRKSNSEALIFRAAYETSISSLYYCLTLTLSIVQFNWTIFKNWRRSVKADGNWSFLTLNTNTIYCSTICENRTESRSTFIKFLYKVN